MFSKTALAGKSILITGGGSGLGYSMAERFVELGAKVAICGRTQEKLDAAKAKLTAKAKDEEMVFAGVADVREYESIAAFVTAASEGLGSLNCLVNNAAGNFYCASEDLTPGGFRAVVDIVLQGSFNATHAFGNHIIEKKQPGSILNIVTSYTETGSAFVLPSACAKAGVYAMTTTLAYEWACYNIRVNAIAPGPFPTKGAWDRLMPDSSFEDSYKAMQPLGRFGEAIELANTATFLLSDAASYVSGDCISVDGAERLRGGQFNFLTQLMPRPKLKSLFQKMRGAGKK